MGASLLALAKSIYYFSLGDCAPFDHMQTVMFKTQAASCVSAAVNQLGGPLWKHVDI